VYTNIQIFEDSICNYYLKKKKNILEFYYVALLAVNAVNP